MLYLVIKYLHILLEIVAVGLNASYGAWLVRGQRSPEHLPFALRGVKFLDDWIANPCYLLLLLSGAAMMAVAPWPLTTRWLDAAIVLWIVAVAIGYGVYTPTLRGQIRTLAAEGAGSAAYQALAVRGQVVGGALGVVVLVILGLMVFKPSLG
jgi:uncharacterized membrane protein